MRITNTMISDNAALNINGNKIMVDANNTKMTTQKKINRPSEDPVIAIRSLKLQTSLVKINQYYEKNIPDADSWLDVTETALLNIRDIMTDVRTLAVQGSTDTLTEEDRKTIYTQLKKLQEQCFAEGNADYAGRTVFTGFRTDKNLVFMSDDKNTTYDIEEPMEAVSMTKSRFYTNEVEIPTNPTMVNDLQLKTSYSEVTSVEPMDGWYVFDGANFVPATDITTDTYTTYYQQSYSEVTSASDNPSELGWYVKDGDGYTLTTDTTVDAGTTYYQMFYETVNVDPSEQGWYVKNGNQYTLTTDTTVDPSTTYYTKNNTGDVLPSDMTIQESDYYKLRLSYNLNQGGTVTDSVTALNFYTKNKDDSLTLRNTIDLTAAEDEELTNSDGETITYQALTAVALNSDASGNDYPEAAIAAVFQFDNESDWAIWSKQQYVYDDDGNIETDTNGNPIYQDRKYVPDDAIVIIRETGDAIYGEKVATSLMTDKVNLSFDYTKTGFNKGELRPEYYFDSVLRIDENGNEMGEKSTAYDKLDDLMAQANPSKEGWYVYDNDSNEYRLVADTTKVDGTTYYQKSSDSDSYEEVTDVNPFKEGWYVFQKGQYVLSTDTKPVDGRIYYQAGETTYAGIRYDRYDKARDEEGNFVLTKQAYYSIDYTISQNQTLGVNLEAEECFNHDIYQDMSDMIGAVSKAMAAHDKVEKIKAMQKEDQYQADPYPEKLAGWLEIAQKEMDYYDNNLSKLYSTTLGKVDTYLSKVNLAITDLGCRSDQLKLTEKRMSDQQETVEELKSNNDNLDLSQIIMDYTSSYTAYQSSLVAAGKLGEQTLLNYI